MNHWIFLGLLIGGCQCGEPAPLTGCGNDPECAGCCAEGEACNNSINCSVGSICNTPQDGLYDPSRPMGVCLAVVCSSPDVCRSDETCTPGGVCETSVCVLADDCSEGATCAAGVCEPRRRLADDERCVLVPHRLALSPGARTHLEVVAFAADGSPRATPAIEAVFDASASLSADGAWITATAEAGATMVRARADGIDCEGSIEVINHGALPPGSVRVVVVSERDGRALEGAALVVEDGIGTSTATTDRGGAWRRETSSPLRRVTASAPGFATVTVLEPGPLDLVLALPEWDLGAIYGVRSLVDATSARRLDFSSVLSGANLGADLADLGYRGLLTPQVPFDYRLPEVGLDHLEGNYAASFAFRLGKGGGGCGRSSGLDDFDPRDCALALGTHETSDLWAIAGSEVFSSVIDRSFGIALPQRHAGVTLHPLATFSLGTARCDADFQSCDRPGEYRSVSSTISASTPRRAIVDLLLPDLPDRCDAGVVVMVATELPGRGLVPLGFASGQREPDHCVWEAATAFGHGYPEIDPQDGRLLLSYASAPLGAEGHPLYAVAIVSPGAVSQDQARAMLGTPSTAFTMIVAPVESDGPRFETPFLSWPKASLSVTHEVVLEDVPSATLLRIERRNSGLREIVYAPASRRGLSFATAVEGASIELTAARTAAGYGELFRLGSGQTLELPARVARSAAVSVCGPDPGPCAPR